MFSFHFDIFCMYVFLMRRNSLTIILAFLADITSGLVDLTRIAGTIGEEVVDATINQIKDSCVFRNDYLFLKRLAFVASNYGTAADTYRSGYDGGIWQVSSSQYSLTKLPSYDHPIAENFDITWSKTTWSDLRKPLYSGIAVMIIIDYDPKIWSRKSVPVTIEAQASVYESLGGDKSSFVTSVSNMSSGCVSDNLDMAFLIDASGSVGSIRNRKNSLLMFSNLLRLIRARLELR
jgi:hypothetical protein